LTSTGQTYNGTKASAPELDFKPNRQLPVRMQGVMSKARIISSNDRLLSALHSIVFAVADPAISLGRAKWRDKN
jgi:hypothetical protein